MKVRVNLPQRGYEIWVGRGVVKRLGKWLHRGTRCFLFADTALRKEVHSLAASLEKAGCRPRLLSLGTLRGEGVKDFKTIYPIYGQLLEAGADRGSVIIALGGGAIGDAAGFLAGTFMRGIRWVGVPTTLLAQVDSAIGGKTAVNHERGKNLVGVFHQPSLVVCDSSYFKTLSPREMISGLGEVVKYGLIFDAKFFGFLKKNWEQLRSGKASVLEKTIARCAALKAATVTLDERDVTGVREVLNFGHTIGHALESVAGYGVFRHGEAVILGMRAAVQLSVIRGHLPSKEGAEIERFLKSISIPRIPRGLKAEDLLKPLKHDKKSHHGRVRFVLLSRIGKTVPDPNVSDREILEAIERIGIPR